MVSIQKEQEVVSLEEKKDVNLEENEVVSLLTPVVTLTEEEGEVTSVRRTAMPPLHPSPRLCLWPSPRVWSQCPYPDSQ